MKSDTEGFAHCSHFDQRIDKNHEFSLNPLYTKGKKGYNERAIPDIFGGGDFDGYRFRKTYKAL